MKIVGAYTEEATEGQACKIQGNFYRHFPEFRKQLIHLLLHYLLKTFLLIIMQKCEVCPKVFKNMTLGIESSIKPIVDKRSVFLS